MRRALIDSENSFIRNAIGYILLGPIILVSMIIALPFALFGRPSKTTAEEVAVYLNDFIEDKGGAWDWDDFVSVPIAETKLDSIRARASQVDLPIDDSGIEELRDLLSEVMDIIEKEETSKGSNTS